jgi:hypothetical protein
MFIVRLCACVFVERYCSFNVLHLLCVVQVVRIFAKDTVEAKVVALQKEKRSGARAQQRERERRGSHGESAKDTHRERHNEVVF